MKYLFGPVYSRRLGFSLGVDLVPRKVCSMDCLYCEVGKTTNKTLKRAEYVPLDKVEKELTDYLNLKPNIDFVTFSGYGEPTLFSRLGELVEFLRKNYPEYKLALLTNSSLLNNDEVIEEVKDINVVLPSFDAASQDIFEKINRPVKGLTVKDIESGIKKLIDKTNCKVWVETLFVRGINDKDEEIERIGNFIKEAKPDKWQLNTVVRPPSYNVKGLTIDELKRIKDMVGYPNTEIIVKSYAAKRKIPIGKLKEEIYDLIIRRPCPVDEISTALGTLKEEAQRIVDELISEGKAEKVKFGNKTYIKGRA